MLVANPTDGITLQMDQDEPIQVTIEVDDDMFILIPANDPSRMYYYPDEETAIQKCSDDRGVIELKDGNRLHCSTNLSNVEEQKSDGFNIFPWLYLGILFGFFFILYNRYRLYKKLQKDRRGDFRSR